MHDETEDGKLIATAVPGAYVLDSLDEYAGVGYAEVKITGWEDVKRLPQVLMSRGRLYGYSAWNSDRLVAIYRTDRVIAWEQTR